MRKTQLYLTTVKCDYPSCPAQFVTGSMASIARKQAALDGWQRIAASKVHVPGGALGPSKQRVDVCPEHKPRPIMEGARP